MKTWVVYILAIVVVVCIAGDFAVAGGMLDNQSSLSMEGTVTAVSEAALSAEVESAQEATVQSTIETTAAESSYADTESETAETKEAAQTVSDEVFSDVRSKNDDTAEAAETEAATEESSSETQDSQDTFQVYLLNEEDGTFEERYVSSDSIMQYKDAVDEGLVWEQTGYDGKRMIIDICILKDADGNVLEKKGYLNNTDVPGIIIEWNQEYGDSLESLGLEEEEVSEYYVDVDGIVVYGPARIFNQTYVVN